MSDYARQMMKVALALEVLDYHDKNLLSHDLASSPSHLSRVKQGIIAEAINAPAGPDVLCEVVSTHQHNMAMFETSRTDMPRDCPPSEGELMRAEIERVSEYAANLEKQLFDLRSRMGLTVG